MNTKLLWSLPLLAGLALADDSKVPPPITDVGAWYVDGEAPDDPPAWAKDGAVDFEALKGKVVVLEFWLSWCPGCTRVRPALTKLHEKHPDDLLMLGITIPDQKQSRADIRRYVKEHVSFPVGVLEKGDTVGRYRVGKIPHAVVIDRAGQITYVGNPDRDTKGFNKAVRKALKQKAPAKD